MRDRLFIEWLGERPSPPVYITSSLLALEYRECPPPLSKDSIAGSLPRFMSVLIFAKMRDFTSTAATGVASVS